MKKAPFRKLQLLTLFLLQPGLSFARQQQLPSKPDTGKLQEVIVTGNKYNKSDDLRTPINTPQPMQVITHKTIALMGSRRLDEVLREQTGMAMVSDLGSGNRAIGLQMQGFSSGYITILLNGQPMAGRTNGNFDLSRISVSDIERIEIIKGASSSLYGSEALGGVINIITRQHVSQQQIVAQALYGTNNTADVSLEAQTPFSNNKSGVYLTGNYYRTDGSNVNPYLKDGTTSPPYNSIALQGRAYHAFNDKNTLHVTGRFANRRSVMDRSYGAMPTRDELKEKDLNGMLALNSQWKSGLKTIARYYFTTYASGQQTTLLQNNNQLQSNDFTENIHRVELQASQDLLQKKLTVIGGVGSDYQSTTSAEEGSAGHMFNYFGYLQASYAPQAAWRLIAGLRYDGNDLYGGKLNPATAVSYSPASWITVKASLGMGYKAPTWRQLYQVFTNITQGYTVIGANAYSTAIRQLKEAGLVQQVWPIANNIGTLQPETSTSWNAGFTLQPVSRVQINVNGFYNQIRNMIINQQIGIKTNGAQLFSWFNIAQSYTTGLEASVAWQPVTGLTLTGGYQLLYAKDKAIIDSIEKGSGQYGTVRTPSAIRKAVTTDYFGLPNRSRHMANVQAFYEYRPWGLSITCRVSWRSRYGFLDQDNNGYIDQFDVFVKGYTLINGSIHKSLLKNKLILQLILDNAGNYTDMLMPAQPGRILMAGATWKFIKQHKKAL